MDPDLYNSCYVDADPDRLSIGPDPLSNMIRIYADPDLQHPYLGYHPDLNRW